MLFNKDELYRMQMELGQDGVGSKGTIEEGLVLLRESVAGSVATGQDKELLD